MARVDSPSGARRSVGEFPSRGTSRGGSEDVPGRLDAASATEAIPTFIEVHGGVLSESLPVAIDSRTSRSVVSHHVPRCASSLVRAGPGDRAAATRAFLGVTFVFAGLQKLSDPNFFTAGATSSIQAQLPSSERTSPIGGALHGASHLAVPLGVVVALAELAVGLGTLLGLWTRLAAVGGALLSVGFLLAVSWHTHPYYYGADVVFVFAWIPILLAGGGLYSVDAWLRSRPPATAPSASPNAAPTPGSATPAARPAGVAVGPASAVPVGGAASFNEPGNGEPAYPVQPRPGQFVAVNAVCTHAGCTVQYQPPKGFVCPCHGAEFDASTGAVLRGPARAPLSTIPIAMGPAGH